MRISPLVLLQIAALLIIAATAFAQAESSATNATCPAGTNRHELDGLLFCVPQSNERHQFTPKGIEPMYWLADDPIGVATANPSYLALVPAAGRQPVAP